MSRVRINIPESDRLDISLIHRNNKSIKYFSFIELCTPFTQLEGIHNRGNKLQNFQFQNIEFYIQQ